MNKQLTNKFEGLDDYDYERKNRSGEREGRGMQGGGGRKGRALGEVKCEVCGWEMGRRAGGEGGEAGIWLKRWRLMRRRRGGKGS